MIGENEDAWEDWENDYVKEEIPHEKTFQEKLDDFDPKNELNNSEIEFIKELYAENDELLDTLNPLLLKSEYMQLFSVKQLSRIVCDVDFQAKLLSLNNEQYKIFSECCKTITEQGNNWSVPVYAAGVDFMMCTHMVGAFSNSNEGDASYKDKWNICKKQSHVFALV